MASPNDYPSGLNLAGTVFANGPETLQLDGKVYLSGLVQWLDTINGIDGALPLGSRPEQPVKTLAQAVTNSANNGVIVIGEGSSESLALSQSLVLTGLSIFGCGIGSSRPRYTCTGAVNMFNVGGQGIWIEGLYFPASTAVPTARIALQSTSALVKDCYFECGASDTSRAISIIDNANRVKGCSFVVTALRPAIGIEVVNSVNDTVVENCTFDGGSYGWTDYALKVSNAALRVREIANTYINRSDLGHTVTGSTYQIFGNDMGGTGNVLLTA